MPPTGAPNRIEPLDVCSSRSRNTSTHPSPPRWTPQLRAVPPSLYPPAVPAPPQPEHQLNHVLQASTQPRHPNFNSTTSSEHRLSYIPKSTQSTTPPPNWPRILPPHARAGAALLKNHAAHPPIHKKYHYTYVSHGSLPYVEIQPLSK